MTYTFPPHFPNNCPPQPHTGIAGIFYKVVKNMDKSDPTHFKSQYDLGEMAHLEPSEGCGRRSVSILASRDEAVRLSQQYQQKGKFIAQVNLSNGHGVIHHSPTKNLLSHHDWWIPDGVMANTCCVDIRERS